jgi:NitT/TauT family transport system permease protein
MKSLWGKTEHGRQVTLTILVLLGIWELGVRVLHVREFMLPAPSKIIVEFFKSPSYLLLQSLSTLETTIVGFALAVVLGVVIAIGIVSFRFLDRTLYSLLVALNAVPKVALAPLFIIWLGTGSAPKIAVATLIAIFPILIDTVLGLKSTDPDMLDMARVNQASRWKMLWKIRFPNALPSIFSGMKVGVSFALVGTIVGEFVAGGSGLGHVILVAQGSFDTPTVFVALALLCVLGVLLFKIIEGFEKRLLGWHASQRQLSSDGLAATGS